MIVATGIDLVDVERFRRVMGRWGERFLRRVFTPGEIEYSQSKRFPHLSFAARFAAKEAVRKALDRPMAWRSIEVVNKSSGKPSIKLASGSVGSIVVSLSHTREHALAQAILVEDERGKRR